MSKSHKDQRKHRRKVAGTIKGLAEHRKRGKRRDGGKGKDAVRKEEARQAPLTGTAGEV
jgi:hypothetical protein